MHTVDTTIEAGFFQDFCSFFRQNFVAQVTVRGYWWSNMIRTYLSYVLILIGKRRFCVTATLSEKR